MKSQVLTHIVATAASKRAVIFGCIGPVINECFGKVIKVTRKKKTIVLHTEFRSSDTASTISVKDLTSMLGKLPSNYKVCVRPVKNEDSINSMPTNPITVAGFREERNRLTFLLPNPL